MSKTLDDLKKDFYLNHVIGATPTMSISDLETLFFADPMNAMAGPWVAITNVVAGVAATANPTTEFIPQARTEVGNTVRMRGRFDISAIIGANNTLFTLPVGYEPSRIVAFSSRLSTTMVRMLVNMDGTVVINSATAAGQQLYIDGLTYTK